MDFSKVTIIPSANSRKNEAPKETSTKPTFHLKVDYAKEKITFSPTLFEQIQLEHNSLAQGIGPDGELLLLVMPGSTGIFAKTQVNSSSKGRTFKNHKFVQDLVSRGWNGSKFNLDFVGEHEGILYYSVVPFGDTEAPAETSEEKTEDSDIPEEEVQFN